MLITNKPKPLETKASQLEEEAARCDARGLPHLAKSYRDRARRLREQADALRARRTDGVRFA